MRRRGSIRQRGESFELTIWHTDAISGEKKRTFETFKGTAREASAHLTLRLRETDVNEFVEPRKTTLGEYLLQWLATYAEPSVSATCYQRWKSIVDHHLVPGLGAHRLSDLRAFHLQKHYAASMKPGGRKDGRKGGLSARTILNHHRLLSEALGHAVKWDMLARNPATGVTLPRIEIREMKVLDIRESQWLLECARGTRPYYPILLAIRLGLRRGEVLGVRFGDIDVAGKSIVIARSIEETRQHGTRVKSPKNGRARGIAISTALLQELLALKAERNASDDEYICAGDDGQPWRPSAFTSAYRDLLRRRNLKGPNFHALRHGHASQLIQQKTDPKVLSTRLGHSRTSFTLDVYGHLYPGQDAEAAERLERAYESAAKEALPKRTM